MDKVRKELVGTVVSDSNDKTVTVLVETTRLNKKYKKQVKYAKKYAAHDESNKTKVGDVVKIVETKPISKSKKFYVAEIVKEAIIL